MSMSDPKRGEKMQEQPTNCERVPSPRAVNRTIENKDEIIQNLENTKKTLMKVINEQRQESGRLQVKLEEALKEKAALEAEKEDLEEGLAVALRVDEHSFLIEQFRLMVKDATDWVDKGKGMGLSAQDMQQRQEHLDFLIGIQRGWVERQFNPSFLFDVDGGLSKVPDTFDLVDRETILGKEATKGTKAIPEEPEVILIHSHINGEPVGIQAMNKETGREMDVPRFENIRKGAIIRVTTHPVPAEELSWSPWMEALADSRWQYGNEFVVRALDLSETIDREPKES